MKSWSLATWAELLKFHTVWIVAAVLLGDVVTFFAVNARHSDLWADIRALAGHGDSLFLYLLLMNRGVRIPSLRGCGKKEGFSRIDLWMTNPRAPLDFSRPPGALGPTVTVLWIEIKIPGALATFVTPSGALVETLADNCFLFQEL